MNEVPNLEFLVGTYTLPGGNGGGVHHVRLPTDAPGEAEVRLVAEAANPSWVATLPGSNIVVAAEEVAEGSRILTWAWENGTLTPLGMAEVPGAGPCHAGAHPSLPLIATAHYGDGTAALWRVTEGLPKLLQRFAFDGSGPVKGRQEASHAHFAMFLDDGRGLAITDLGGDAIHFYDVDDTANPVAWQTRRLDLPPGSGPRHIAAGRDALFVSCELDETVRTLVQDGDGYRVAAEIAPFSPVAGAGGALSGIRMSPDGKSVFVAGRNQTAIARLRVGADGRLEPDTVFDCGGRHPRDFAFDPSGRWMVVANQHSDGLALFEIDPSGPIRPRGTVPIGSPACILFNGA